MPRIDRRELECLEIGGVPVAICFARDRHVVLQIAGYDADGLLESPEDVKAQARRFLARFDKFKGTGKTTSGSPELQNPETEPRDVTE